MPPEPAPEDPPESGADVSPVTATSLPPMPASSVVRSSEPGQPSPKPTNSASSNRVVPVLMMPTLRLLGLSGTREHSSSTAHRRQCSSSHDEPAAEASSIDSSEAVGCGTSGNHLCCISRPGSMYAPTTGVAWVRIPRRRQRQDPTRRSRRVAEPNSYTRCSFRTSLRAPANQARLQLLGGWIFSRRSNCPIADSRL